MRTLLALPTLLFCSFLPACVTCEHGGVETFFDGGADLRHEERSKTEGALELAGGSLLAVELPAGSVRVSVSEGPAKFEATLVARASSSAAALEALAASELVVEPRAEGLGMRLATPSSGGGAQRWHVRADLVLHVPAGVRLQLSTGSGAIELCGPLGDSVLRSSYGSLDASGLRGNLVAKTGSGSVQVADVRGDVVELESSYGKVALRSVEARRVEAKSGSGAIELQSVQAETVRASTSYGSVQAREVVGSLEARSGSGRVSVGDLRGSLEAHSSYGQVDCEGVFEGLVAHSGSGSVEVRAHVGSSPRATWKLSSGYGRVRLALPDDFGCELDARTSYGEVDIGFPIQIEPGGLKVGSRKVSGRIGAGGGRVELSSGSGSVAVVPLSR